MLGTEAITTATPAFVAFRGDPLCRTAEEFLLVEFHKVACYQELMKPSEPFFCIHQRNLISVRLRLKFSQVA
jgi:hypothetical protein